MIIKIMACVTRSGKLATYRVVHESGRIVIYNSTGRKPPKTVSDFIATHKGVIVPGSTNENWITKIYLYDERI